MKTHEKSDEIRPVTFNVDLENKADTMTIECNVCNQLITDSTYDHQIVDGVLICSNLGAIIVDADGGVVTEDPANLVASMHSADGTNLLLGDDTNQQVIISLSGLKEEIF